MKGPGKWEPPCSLCWMGQSGCKEKGNLAHEAYSHFLETKATAESEMAEELTRLEEELGSGNISPAQRLNLLEKQRLVQETTLHAIATAEREAGEIITAARAESEVKRGANQKAKAQQNGGSGNRAVSPVLSLGDVSEC